MRIRGWGLSDVGRRRAHNEDRFICNDKLALYAVADGMGGHLGGERASRMAIEIVEAKLASAFEMTRPTGAPPASAVTPDEALRTAIAEADRRIYELSSTDPEVAGMGTTLTALFFRDRRAYLGHVGDSR